MSREMAKVSSIAKELISFFLIHGEKNISLTINDKEDRTEISIHINNGKFSDEEIENIKNALYADREIENEEYYWQVIGVGSKGDELSAIGVMIDDTIIKWNKPSLDILLIRKKHL